MGNLQQNDSNNFEGMTIMDNALEYLKQTIIHEQKAEYDYYKKNILHIE